MSDHLSFEKLGIPIQDSIKEYPLEKQQEIYDYLISMDEKQKKAYKIAFEHLGTSFHIYRSNGFRDWIKCKAENK
jgi:hypothetical protein